MTNLVPSVVLCAHHSNYPWVVCCPSKQEQFVGNDVVAESPRYFHLLLGVPRLYLSGLRASSTPGCNLLGSSFNISNGTSEFTLLLIDLTSSGQILAFNFLSIAPRVRQLIGTSGSYSLGGTEFLSFTMSNFANGSATIQVHYGPLFKSIKEATYNIQNDVLWVSIDGRAFNPIGISSLKTNLTFMDSNPAPNFKSAANLTASLQAMQSKITTSNSCSTLLTPTVEFTPRPIPTNLRVRQNGPDYSQNPGHTSSLFTSSGCTTCLVPVEALIVAQSLACPAIWIALPFTNDY